MFKVGQKVICVDASPVRSDCASAMPLRLSKGTTYTVRSIQTEPGIDGYGVRLEELLNPSMIWADGDEKEWAYDYRRFKSEDHDALQQVLADALASR
jgi:hypothetical protein